MYYAIKVLVTAGLVVAISEIAKRSSLLGALLASLPLTSLLAMIWIWYETKDQAKIAALSTDIFWLVLPSLPMFLILPALLRQRFAFWAALGISSAITAGLYLLIGYCMKRA